MKILVLLSCLLWFGGCAAIQEEIRQAEQAQERYWSQRANVLYKGAAETEVTGAWGVPNGSSSFGGAVNGRTVQYGRCAASASVTRGVVFITFLNGQLFSWRAIQC